MSTSKSTQQSRMSFIDTFLSVEKSVESVEYFVSITSMINLSWAESVKFLPRSVICLSSANNVDSSGELKTSSKLQPSPLLRVALLQMEPLKFAFKPQ